MSDSVYVNGNKTEGPQAATSLRTLFKNAGVVSPPAEAGTVPAKEQTEGSVADMGSGSASASVGAKRADDSGSADAQRVEPLSQQKEARPLYVCATSDPSEQAKWGNLKSGEEIETAEGGRRCI